MVISGDRWYRRLTVHLASDGCTLYSATIALEELFFSCVRCQEGRGKEEEEEDGGFFPVVSSSFDNSQ